MSNYGTDLRTRRLRAGLTQRELAARSGTSQPAIAAIENGVRSPALETRARLDAALRVRPSILLENALEQVREVLGRYQVTNPRVFGSVARGEDTEESDVDLLVTTPADFDIFDKVMLTEALEEVLGVHVDVVPDDARGATVARATAEAVPL
ncbi:helix-turn-helix domain-containing protein [Promicromonospora sp. NPDC060271]|uniref:helix-turn-helix domain-containing protein n=1 Tax=Promicromonospora sp. NPDC060271 TaxID=3347089 RepID=UPI003650BE86